MEDDPALRAVTRDVLEGAGYRVHVASRAEEALAVSEAHPAAIELLLSDVVVLWRSGPELAAELLARRPGLRVLYTSGYTSDAIARHGIQEAGVRSLQKPFSPSELLGAVRAALDEAAEPPAELDRVPDLPRSVRRRAGGKPASRAPHESSSSRSSRRRPRMRLFSSPMMASARARLVSCRARTFSSIEPLTTRR